MKKKVYFEGGNPEISHAYRDMADAEDISFGKL